MAQASPPPLAADLTAEAFEGVALNLFELWRANYPAAGMTIRGKRFVDCIIEGPAVLLPVQGCRFDACDFGDAKGDIRNLLLAPESPSRITGAIPMADCSFEGCRFFAVGFTGSKAFLDSMLEVQPEGGAVEEAGR